VIRGYKGIRPTLGARAFVDVSAQVIDETTSNREPTRASG